MRWDAHLHYVNTCSGAHSPFGNSHTNRCEIRSHCDSNVHLWWITMWNIFSYTQLFVHFLFRNVYFGTPSCLSQVIDFFSEVWFTNTFSHLVDWHFILTLGCAGQFCVLTPCLCSVCVLWDSKDMLIRKAGSGVWEVYISLDSQVLLFNEFYQI